MLLLLACTTAGPEPADDTSDTSPDGVTWIPPENVTPENAGGFHDDSIQDTLFDDDDLASFALVIADSDIAQMRREDKYSEHDWVPAEFIYEGVTYSNIGVRIKGENSFLPIDQKPSLKLKFDKFVDGLEFAGLDELTLNNMSNDYSMMHERVAYRFFREAGIPASRASHGFLELNGENYGLYAVIETVDPTMMKAWVDKPKDGSMWEVWDVDFYDRYIDKFQHEFGVEDRTHLQGVADGMEVGTGQASWDAAAEFMDMEAFVRFYAAETVVGQFDSYPFANPGDDAHVYVHPETNRLIWLPHGIDEAFYDPTRNPLSVNGILAKRCLNIPSCTAEFNAAVWEMQALAEEIDLHGYAVQVYEQIYDYCEEDPNRPYNMDYVRYYQNVMLDFIEDRPAALVNWVGPRPE
jgi:hypothetical protein